MDKNRFFGKLLVYLRKNNYYKLYALMNNLEIQSITNECVYLNIIDSKLNATIDTHDNKSELQDILKNMGYNLGVEFVSNKKTNKKLTDLQILQNEFKDILKVI